MKSVEAVDVNSMDPGIPLYLWMLLFLLFLVIAFIGLVNFTSRNGTTRSSFPSPNPNKKMKRLKEQYANGKISEEEYQKRMKIMEKQSAKR